MAPGRRPLREAQNGGGENKLYTSSQSTADGRATITFRLGTEFEVFYVACRGLGGLRKPKPAALAAA